MNNQQKRKCHNLGFSLVEIVIAVAIIGVLAGVSIPVYLGYVEKSRRQKWLTESENFRKSFEIAMTDVCSKGYDPQPSKVVLYNGTLHELWGSDYGTYVKDVVEQSFGENYGDIANVTVQIDDQGGTDYIYVEFLRGAKSYKYYFFTKPQFKNTVPSGHIEELSGGWYIQE